MPRCDLVPGINYTMDLMENLAGVQYLVPGAPSEFSEQIDFILKPEVRQRRPIARRRTRRRSRRIAALLGIAPALVVVWIPRQIQKFQKTVAKKHVRRAHRAVTAIIGRPTVWFPKPKVHPKKPKAKAKRSHFRTVRIGLGAGTIIGAAIEWIVRNRRRRR